MCKGIDPPSAESNAPKEGMVQEAQNNIRSVAVVGAKPVSKRANALGYETQSRPC
jgi:hypothetical protein